MNYVQSCPQEASLVASKKPLVKCSCGIFSFFVLIYWIKFERLKREPTSVGSQEILDTKTYIYYSFLVRATFGQLSLFLFPTSSSNSKTKGKRYYHFNHNDSQGVAKATRRGLWTTIAQQLKYQEVKYPFFISLYNNTYNPKNRVTFNWVFTLFSLSIYYYTVTQIKGY